MATAFGSLAWIPEAWEGEAACHGADLSLFFAPNYFERKAVKDAREKEAKTFCARCPVVDECREYALDTREEHGVWGGLNERERRRLRRRRQQMTEAREALSVVESGTG